MAPELPGIADLERLEADVEEALIALIDRPSDDPMIADLQRRKLHLLAAIERLRRRYGAAAGSVTLH